MSRVEITGCILDGAWITPTMCLYKSPELVVVFKSIFYTISFSTSKHCEETVWRIDQGYNNTFKVNFWLKTSFTRFASFDNKFIKNSQYNGRLSTFFAPFSAARGSHFLIYFFTLFAVPAQQQQRDFFSANKHVMPDVNTRKSTLLSSFCTWKWDSVANRGSYRIIFETRDYLFLFSWTVNSSELFFVFRDQIVVRVPRKTRINNRYSWHFFFHFSRIFSFETPGR